MTRSERKILVRFAAGIVVALMAAGHAGGTPITGGEISLEFTNQLTPTDPWDIKVTLHWAVPSENGQIALTIPAPEGGGSREVVLWEGTWRQGDSIVLEYTVPPPPPGRHHVGASYKQHPERKHGFGGTAKVAYVLVREDTVFLAWSSNWENMNNELEYDLRKRGLEDVDPKLLDSLAPDLAERWRKVKGWEAWKAIGPPPKTEKSDQSPPAPVYQPERIGTAEGRDTILIPGSGPPPARPTPDSVKARE